MIRQVVLSRIAEKKLENLFSYLEINWSEKVKNNFILILKERVNILTKNPEVFPKSKIKAGLHKCVVTRHTTLYYTFNDKYINILTVFDNRQSPSKLIDEIT